MLIINHSSLNSSVCGVNPSTTTSIHDVAGRQKVIVARMLGNDARRHLSSVLTPDHHSGDKVIVHATEHELVVVEKTCAK
ncbi:hypothetical protein DCAR_0310013 [Daucus carota subsp. sativus]|uniref:Uncharacterized protein n=1 Tax=Daucus carota subsp. sativus TaxID=79200 RepID=A0A165ZJD5_DAUCS|nr:hypothetical protein DCAR_0310013 [Daucus carota subsp. sativus]